MPLAVGTRLGSYEIVALIGVGGMGEVYRAHDPALNRDVAIKVLPEEFVNDPDRVARFKREAQVLASLNHPNIAQIYGFEDSGPIKFLVMELVEGETLAARITGRSAGSGLQAIGSGQSLQPKAIPLDEVLTMAQQVADALEAAHEKAITHRDLKPANIMLTAAEGRVKVLDFGLAKFDTGGSGPGSASYANSPTLTALPTQAGVILGTAAYMSPEQAKGRAADKRSDVWAFGCVLYEMLTGTRAFGGEDVSNTLAAVLRGEPDWTKLPAETPAKIRSLLSRCLQKDRAKRLRDIYVRRLNELQATPLSGTDNARDPFFSPDGRWLAFFSGGKLKKISVAGGATVVLCDTTNDRGGDWLEDGTIVFVGNAQTGVSRVSSDGGEPLTLTTLAEGEVTQRYPQMLPGGNALLYTGHVATGNFEEANVVVQPLPSGARKIVQRGGYYGRYLTSGHLVYIHDGNAVWSRRLTLSAWRL